jgi:ArsR family transcriptional regulator, arsenate/arsenite/antimonite-responsive transcriptional repressor
MNPITLFKCLADETRLKTVMLIQSQGELCVCELTTALETSQPKVSRHLAQLRECGLLNTRRAGQWVYYSINKQLPDWALSVLEVTSEDNLAITRPCCIRLEGMGERPQRDLDYCGATQ